ncbi:MAG: ABC transporter permease [Rhodospirillaceae bacterium]|jgi:peptide/nickel transport system permease protein|nr:ABC transporter permease [Rhodospirillales bacterium]MBT3906423.1 ABC transporter permease [Rhodospirillaceae bacterium]MBT4703624.1 ABC transporter permease [Rhodospirillaceae bacterium]MBT5034587.1 ABC transporter permease [Rhodospirillaceae bacterium]MBT6221182.1 ABC transporter permease [Rhodospirillaceae bacterium]
MPPNISNPAVVESDVEVPPEKKLRRRVLIDFVRKQPLGATGAATIIIMMLMAVFADFITVYDPEAAKFEDMLTAPGDQYLLGSDQFGRDILTRIIYGARTALFIGLTAGFLGASIGLVLGVTSAYFGGRFDLIFQRVMDVMLAFPLIILALAIVSILGTGIQNVILAIVIVKIALCARVVRSNALAIRELPYVDAARVLGFDHARIILRHMVPNVMAPFLIILTYYIGDAILLEATLSFLGLGLQEPTPSWGLMLQGGAEEYAESAPWMPIWPGVAISLAVFGFNLFGDALRDILDPKMRIR